MEIIVTSAKEVMFLPASESLLVCLFFVSRIIQNVLNRFWKFGRGVGHFLSSENHVGTVVSTVTTQ